MPAHYQPADKNEVVKVVKVPGNHLQYCTNDNNTVVVVIKFISDLAYKQGKSQCLFCITFLTS